MTVLLGTIEGQKNEILRIQNSTIAERCLFVNHIRIVASLERLDSFSFLKNDIVELLKKLSALDNRYEVSSSLKKIAKTHL